MDYYLNIVIPKMELEHLSINEKVNTWGENIYSYSPRQYVTESKIIFEQIEDKNYLCEIVSDIKVDEVLMLHLKSAILSELEYASNMDESVLSNNSLLKFLNELYDLTFFYVILVREDEKVAELCEITKSEEIGFKIIESLKWEKPRDILLYKR